MGHLVMQRLVVRSLFDEAFVEAYHARPREELGALGLDAQEQAQLLAVDRRAWRTDPLRRRRTLRLIGEEFKLSTTLVFAETRSLAFLEGYFSSPEFHGAVQAGGSITLALGDFLQAALRKGRLRTPQLEAVVRLEHTMARCRREGTRAPVAPPAARPVRLRLAPGVAVDAFEANLIETVHVVEQYLFEAGLMLQVALCDDAPRVGTLPAVSDERLYLLLTAAGRDVGMTYLEEPAFRILRETRDVVDLTALVGRCGRQGLPRAAVEGYVDSLLEAGVLVSA